MTIGVSRITLSQGDTDGCSDDSDEEDETAALMAELAKIKAERAEEKARLVSSHRSQSNSNHRPHIFQSIVFMNMIEHGRNRADVVLPSPHHPQQMQINVSSTIPQPVRT